MKINIDKHIEEGRRILNKNPRRDISAGAFMYINDQAADKWDLAEKSYLLGVAIGKRIAQANAKKSEKTYKTS